METLSCAVVGASGCAIAINMDLCASVAELTSVIKLLMKERLESVDVNYLRLYLAMKNGKWMTETDTDAVTHEQMPSFEKLLITCSLEDSLGVDFAPRKEEIQLLLVIPNDQATQMQISDNCYKISCYFDAEILSVSRAELRSR